MFTLDLISWWHSSIINCNISKHVLHFISVMCNQMNEIGKVVHIDSVQLEKDMEGYSKSPRQELLKVFSLDKNGSIE